MADLIMKRLKSLPLGTPVEISYGSAGFFYGFLSDRDEGCIELSGQRRDRLIIRYQGISSLKEWTSASSSGQEPQRDHYPPSFGQSPQWDQSSSSFGQEPQRDHYPSSFGQPPQMGQTSSRASFDEAPGPARLQKEKAEFDQGGQSIPSGEGAFLKEEPGAAADPHPGTVPEGGHPGEAPFLKETESSRDKKAPDETVIAPMPLTEKEAGTPDPSKAPSGEGHDSSLKAQAVPTDSPDQKEEAPSRAGVSFYQTTIPAPLLFPLADHLLLQGPAQGEQKNTDICL